MDHRSIEIDIPSRICRNNVLPSYTSVITADAVEKACYTPSNFCDNLPHNTRELFIINWLCNERCKLLGDVKVTRNSVRTLLEFGGGLVNTIFILSELNARGNMYDTFFDLMLDVAASRAED